MGGGVGGGVGGVGVGGIVGGIVGAALHLPSGGLAGAEHSPAAQHFVGSVNLFAMVVQSLPTLPVHAAVLQTPASQTSSGLKQHLRGSFVEVASVLQPSPVFALHAVGRHIFVVGSQW